MSRGSSRGSALPPRRRLALHPPLRVAGRGTGVRTSTVHVPAVADLDHRHGLGAVIDRVKDAIVPLSDPILLLPGKFLDALRSRCHGKPRDLGGDLTANFRRESLELLGGGTLDEDVIACHAASGLSPPLRMARPTRARAPRRRPGPPRPLSGSGALRH